MATKETPRRDVVDVRVPKQGSVVVYQVKRGTSQDQSAVHPANTDAATKR